MFSSDLDHTRRTMAHDRQKWVLTSIIIQMLHTRSYCVPSYSYKTNDKLLAGVKDSEIDKIFSSQQYNKFQYPKEDTTHGVGYGHHLHPFYYQGNNPLYSCAIQGDWHPIVNHGYHTNQIPSIGKSNSFGKIGSNYFESVPYNELYGSRKSDNIQLGSLEHFINSQNDKFRALDNHRKSDKEQFRALDNHRKSDNEQLRALDNHRISDNEQFKTLDNPSKSDEQFKSLDNHRKSNNEQSRALGNHLRYFTPSTPFFPNLRRSDNIHRSLETDFDENKYVIKSNYEEPMIPIIHNFLSTQTAQPKVLNRTESTINRHKYIIRSQLDEPMIPIIHNFLASTSQDAQPKISNNTDTTSSNKYIIRSNNEEPMIPILHNFLATQVENDASEVTAPSRVEIPTYLTPPPPPPPPPTSTLEVSNHVQYNSFNNKNYNPKQDNIMDILTTLHIIPNSEDIDFF
ncbi:hypothetical protein C0J52_16174 [Blattella germanica]|nr:hypothetical protein C0J52_16174 [Blattella germanica]